MGNVTYDWSPLFQSLNGLAQHFVEQKQYQDLLKTLGTGMPGGTPGLPAPQQAQGGAPQPSPMGGAFNMEMFRKLPPQIGLPLLMQTMQAQMGGTQPHKLEQYDPEKDVVDPYTGQVVRKGTPKAAASTRKYETINGVPGWIDPEQGFTPDPNGPKAAGPQRKYETVNGVAGWIDPENGFTPDPNAPKQAATGEGAETWSNPVTEAGPDGKPIQVRYGNRGGRRVVEGATPAQTGSGQPTVDQARAKQLYGRAKEQLPIVLDNWDALGTTRSAIAENVYGGNAIASGAFQQADAAMRDIAASYLYSVSGATATPSEIEGTVDRVRPKVTDSAATKADKKKRIQDMVESIRQRSSNPTQQSAPSPQAKPPSGQPHTIKSDAEYNSLPSGAVFVGPDGKQRRKP